MFRCFLRMSRSGVYPYQVHKSLTLIRHARWQHMTGIISIPQPSSDSFSSFVNSLLAHAVTVKPDTILLKISLALHPLTTECVTILSLRKKQWKPIGTVLYCTVLYCSVILHSFCERLMDKIRNVKIIWSQ